MRETRERERCLKKIGELELEREREKKRVLSCNRLLYTKPSQTKQIVKLGTCASNPRGKRARGQTNKRSAMMVSTGLSISDGQLNVKGSTLLKEVPENVMLTPSTGLGSVQGAFLGTSSTESKSHHVFPLGVLKDLRFMCCFRFSLWWMTQRMGSSGKEVPVETQFFLTESKDGSSLLPEMPSDADQIVYTVFLPLLEGPFRASLQGNAHDQLELCLESGDAAVKGTGGRYSIFLHAGTDPYKVIGEAVQAVQTHLQTFRRREEKKMPDILDWFGWCTWNAFYTDVSADGVRQGLKSLQGGGTPARFIILDDGWQTIASDQGQASGEVLTQAPYVYAWHAIIGYWGGIKVGAADMEHYESTMEYPIPSQGVLNNEPGMKTDTLTVHGVGLAHPTKVFQFFNELHSYLAAAGVDGVKVDVQNVLETLGTGFGGRVLLTQHYHQALEDSVARNFPNNGCIACMSHNTDGLYSIKQTAVVRASDDFWPLAPATHTIHIASITYNSLFLGEFMQPDWDMFQSDHPAGEYHAAARAIGGCPVYVSDKPGNHDFNLLKKLVLSDGFILRCQLPGRPTRDCLFNDPARDGKSLLKIWNLNKHTGVVGVFNCQGAGWCKERKENLIHDSVLRAASGSFRARDVDLIGNVATEEWGGECAVYSHRGGVLVRLPKGAALPVTLYTCEYELFTISPLKRLLCGADFAPIGLLQMFNSGGAISMIEYESSEQGPNEAPSELIKIKVHGYGDFGAYSSVKPRDCLVNTSNFDFLYNPDSGMVKVVLPEVEGLFLELVFTFPQVRE